MQAPWWCTAGERVQSYQRDGPGDEETTAPSCVLVLSAGVGRTGCFVVIDAMLERMKHEKTVDIYGHVTCMRSQRNYMVQTEDQYVFIHEALLEAAMCGHTEVPARNLYAHIQKLGQVPPGESVTAMELEFKVGLQRACLTLGSRARSWEARPDRTLPLYSCWPTPRPTHLASLVPTCPVTSSRTA